MATITKLSQLDMNATYSYADYLMWKLKERVELIKGKVMAMSPAPNVFHQIVSGHIHGKLYPHFINQDCNLFTAPFDVRLLDKKKSTLDKEVYTVVQPDLCVICDRSKLDDRGALGSPDLVVEILSPGNSSREMKIKFELYQEASVKEYWIVSPIERNVLVYRLERNVFVNNRPLSEEDFMESKLFPQLDFKIKDIFKEK